MSILQRALDSIGSEQRKQIHNKWIGVRYEHGIDYSLFWKSAALFFLVVVFLYFYNRKLKREVEQRKLAEQEAIKARDEADRASQAKSEFLSVVSHELRTPLTSIKGALGLLSGGATPGIPEQAQNMIRIAYENSDRLSLLINDILDIEKMLAGKVDFKEELIEVGELINKAAAVNQGYADQYGVRVVFSSNEHDDCTVTADENRLLQVLSNLVSNAIKHSPQGGSVQIVSECSEKKVRISVRDEGEGVPAGFREHIFTPFSQADSSDTRAKGGTGLGLAIAKEIVEHYGGVIGFDSEPGQGATFYFELNIN